MSCHRFGQYPSYSPYRLVNPSTMAWEPDRRSNFFFSPPAHLCAVTYMTEISLIVTLNIQFTHSLTRVQCYRNSQYKAEEGSNTKHR